MAARFFIPGVSFIIRCTPHLDRLPCGLTLLNTLPTSYRPGLDSEGHFISPCYNLIAPPTITTTLTSPTPAIIVSDTEISGNRHFMHAPVGAKLVPERSTNLLLPLSGFLLFTTCHQDIITT